MQLFLLPSYLLPITSYLPSPALRPGGAGPAAAGPRFRQGRKQEGGGAGLTRYSLAYRGQRAGAGGRAGKGLWGSAWYQ